MSTLDLSSGYFQILMKPEDIAKRVFITKNVRFAFKRMSYGLYGVPSTFQKLINKIMRLFYEGVFVYMGDVIVMAGILKNV